MIYLFIIYSFICLQREHEQSSLKKDISRLDKRIKVKNETHC
jgi:hypothetical protein